MMRTETASGRFMSQESILEELIQKLERLRKLPQTPMRLREIASLERLIASGAKPQKTVRVSRKKIFGDMKNKELDDLYAEDESDVTPQQSRTVEDHGSHRRIILGKKEQPESSGKDEELAHEKEHKQSLSDIQALLGTTFRGFS